MASDTEADLTDPLLPVDDSTDNAPSDVVLRYVLRCANAWVAEARIIGNARAGDIARALTEVAAERDAAIASRDAMREALDRLRGPLKDLSAMRAGMIAAGVTAKTADAILASPAFDRERAALAGGPGRG